MDLIGLSGLSFGPRPMWVSVDAVSNFVSVTGDDSERWSDFAPPGFAAAALFAVASDLLAELMDRSVIHGEQTFTWREPIAIGSQLEVTGTVDRVRERGGVHYISFEIVARDGDRPVLEGNSLFLISSGALPTATDFERAEPPHSYRGNPAEGQKSASRTDLIRYAAATRDWNPIHWDHAAAIAAGLPGVLVHGLLQAAWALAAAENRADNRPFENARVRFRNPLLPAQPVDVIAGDVVDRAVDVTLADADRQYLVAHVGLSDE